MSMETDALRIRGIAEVARALLQLNPRLADKIVKIGLKKPAKYLADAIKAAAPVSRTGSKEKSGFGSYVHFPPGRIQRAVKVKTSRINTYRKNGIIGLYVNVNPGKKRNDPKGAWYAKFQEIGYNTGTANLSPGTVLRSRFSSGGRRAVALDRRFRTTTYRMRGGGTDIAGKHFVLNTFKRLGVTVSGYMIDAAEAATREAAQELNLRVTR